MSPQSADTDSMKQEARQTMKETREQIEEEARTMAQEQRQRAAHMVEERKKMAAGKVDALAEALRASGERLREKQESHMAQCMERVSDRLHSYAGMLRDRDMRDLLQEAKDLARRNPSLFLGGAFALGFALTRFLKSSESEAGGEWSSQAGHASHGTAYSGQGPGQGQSMTGPEPSAAYDGSGLYGGPGHGGTGAIHSPKP